MSRSEGLLIAVAIVAVAAVFRSVVRLNEDMGGAIAPFGWFAYGLGALVSLLVAAGLFFLVFHSARRGYDDLDRPDDDPPP